MRTVIACVLAVMLAFVACGGPPVADPGDLQRRLQKDNEITALWTQIRDFRREAHMDVAPTRQNVFQWGGRTIPEAKNVCPAVHPVPEACNNVCDLAAAICDNAESICTIADDLGKQDDYAQGKCADAKASCSEATQRCCKCSGGSP